MLYNDYMKIINPKRDIVVIKADPPKDKTASGLYIVEDWKTLPPVGTVEAIGPDVKDKDLVGKRVLFERYTSITIDKDIRLCREVNILSEVEDGSEA